MSSIVAAQLASGGFDINRDNKDKLIALFQIVKIKYFKALKHLLSNRNLNLLIKDKKDYNKTLSYHITKYS